MNAAIAIQLSADTAKTCASHCRRSAVGLKPLVTCDSATRYPSQSIRNSTPIGSTDITIASHTQTVFVSTATGAAPDAAT